MSLPLNQRCVRKQIKLRHADLSSQLLRVVHAVDGLEGRFAEASHYHNSRGHQAHSAVAHDLAQVEAGLGHNSGGKPPCCRQLSCCWRLLTVVHVSCWSEQY